jgi:hypothetical protein
MNHLDNNNSIRQSLQSWHNEKTYTYTLILTKTNICNNNNNNNNNNNFLFLKFSQKFMYKLNHLSALPMHRFTV